MDYQTDMEIGVSLENRGAFFRKQAHEVRNPLHVLALGCECLGDGLCGPLNGEQVETLADMQEALHKASLLMEVVFAMEQWFHGALSLRKGECNLLAQMRFVATVAGVTLAKAEGVEAVWVAADGVKMAVALLLLLQESGAQQMMMEVEEKENVIRWKLLEGSYEEQTVQIALASEIIRLHGGEILEGDHQLSVWIPV